MNSLEEKLRDSQSQKNRIIVTDGVFSMDGNIAKLDKICALADKYNALVMVDDSHATGFMGKSGKGTHEHCNVLDRVDIITSTLGKALGGAKGGFTSGRQEIIDILKTMDHPEYNVLMRDTDTEELLRLARQGKKLLKELKK